MPPELAMDAGDEAPDVTVSVGRVARIRQVLTTLAAPLSATPAAAPSTRSRSRFFFGGPASQSAVCR